MSERRDTDEFLADLDETLDDYVEWDASKSADAATWAADGSHEPDEIHGHYYRCDDLGRLAHVDHREWRYPLTGSAVLFTAAAADSAANRPWLGVGILGFITDEATGPEEEEPDEVYRWPTNQSYTVTVTYDRVNYEALSLLWGVSEDDMADVRRVLYPVLGVLTERQAALAGRIYAESRRPEWPYGYPPDWSRWSVRMRGWEWKPIVLPDPVEALRKMRPAGELTLRQDAPYWVEIGHLRGFPVVTPRLD